VRFAHVGRRGGLGHQPIELDRVPFGENPNHVLRLPRSRPLPPAEDAEVVRPGLDYVSPFSKIAVDEIGPEEVAVCRESQEEAIERLPRKLYPAPVDQVERLDR